LNNNGKDN